MFIFSGRKVLNFFLPGKLIEWVLSSSSILERSHSREEERQADQLGFEILTNAGIDPRGFTKFFSRLQIQQQNNDSILLVDFFKTHPNLEERFN